jgi:hypothetical protein
MLKVNNNSLFTKIRMSTDRTNTSNPEDGRHHLALAGLSRHYVPLSTGWTPQRHKKEQRTYMFKRKASAELSGSFCFGTKARISVF